MFKSARVVTYRVADMAKAKEWYSKVLETGPAFEAGSVVIFRIGDTSLTLVPAEEPVRDANGRACVFWEVEDIEDAYRKLLEHGATSNSQIQSVGAGRMARVRDPFGIIIGIWGKLKYSEKLAVENEPSESAMKVAFSRALANRDEREEIRCPDNMAELFISDEQRRILADPALAQRVIATAIMPRLYGFLTARTVYIDRIFREALEANTPQIVFLGAGYDTRSYRFMELIKDTRIFELDVETTQARKREILERQGIRVPTGLSFVTVNFKSDRLQGVLLRAGFERNKRTLFIWEGVMYYLPAGAVDETLSSVRLISAAGSEIVFDYMSEKEESRNAGEPFLSWVESETMESFLAEKGFMLKEHLTPQEIEKRFLTLKDGSPTTGTLTFIGLVRAAVK